MRHAYFLFPLSYPIMALESGRARKIRSGELRMLGEGLPIIRNKELPFSGPTHWPSPHFHIQPCT